MTTEYPRFGPRFDLVERDGQLYAIDNPQPVDETQRVLVPEGLRNAVREAVLPHLEEVRRRDVMARGATIGHRCSVWCKCPLHPALPLIYHAPTAEHACSDPGCYFAIGLRARPFPSLLWGRRNGRSTFRNVAERKFDELFWLGVPEDVAAQTALITAMRTTGMTLLLRVGDPFTAIDVTTGEEARLQDWNWEVAPASPHRPIPGWPEYFQLLCDAVSPERRPS